MVIQSRKKLYVFPLKHCLIIMSGQTGRFKKSHSSLPRAQREFKRRFRLLPSKIVGGLAKKQQLIGIETLVAPKTDNLLLLKSEDWNVSVFIETDSSHLRLIVCVSDTVAGPNCIRADVLSLFVWELLANTTCRKSEVRPTPS